VDPTRISTENAYQLGVASYYARERQGRRTSSGARYNMYRMTAAHRVLPLGTLIKVTNLENGKWVVVEVNDRGPFVRQKILDVSYAAALELDMVRAGSAEVMIELIERAR
jgi:rare lipoprotein A